MDFNIEEKETEMIATMSGRLDTAASMTLAKDIQPLIEKAEKTIILECRDLEFISSSGLRLFLMLRKATIAKKSKVVVKNISNEIKQVFTLTGFYSLFEFAED